MSLDETPDTEPLASNRLRPLETLSAGTFGVLLFLAALTMLFGATIAGYLFLRNQVEIWPPPNSPPMPIGGLWLSTLILLLASVTVHWALRAIRWDRQTHVRIGLVCTIVLGTLFLASQGRNWEQIRQVVVPLESQAHLYVSIFYILTGTHALHVVGGLILLSIVAFKAFHGVYTSTYHPGIRYSMMYWHFLDAVWLILFVLLFLV